MWNIFGAHKAVSHTHTHIIVSSHGDCKAPSNLALFNIISSSFTEWEMLEIKKKNNQFHESFHARLYLRNLSISFHFPLSLKTKLTDAQSFDQSIPIPYFKNTEVWWRVENNLIHVLDTWGSALTHKQTLWAHTLELYSTLHFTLISAEGPVPEWVRPVVSVCQNRWTLDPLSAFPAKQITCLLLPQPSFRLYIFHHPWASAHLLPALPQRQKQIKTFSVGMVGYFGLGASIFVC